MGCLHKKAVGPSYSSNRNQYSLVNFRNLQSDWSPNPLTNSRFDCSTTLNQLRLFPMSKLKTFSLVLMAIAYVAAGVNHFVNPHFYKAIMPPWLPVHDLLISISGLVEIVLGTLLIPTATRLYAAWGIILLLIAVFPANIQMLINYYHQHHPNLLLAVLRLPVQLLLIWWAYTFTRRRKIAL